MTTASVSTPPGDPPSPPRDAPRPKTAKDERAERLAAQLRTNLRRRKDQVRGRDASERSTAGEPPEEG